MLFLKSLIELTTGLVGRINLESKFPPIGGGGANANLALLLSAVIAMGTLVYQRGLSWGELAKSTEIALMSGGPA